MGFSKGSTSTFIVERKMYLKPDDYAYLESRMYIANRMYNAGVKHYRWVLNTFHSDTNFISAFEKFKELADKRNKCNNKKENTALNAEIKQCLNDIYVLAKGYGLTEAGVHGYFANLKNRAYNKSLSIDIIQKLGSELFAGIDKCILSTKRILHYRKHNQTNTLSNKKDGSGFKFDCATDTLYFGIGLKRKAQLKPIRQKDTYLKKAMKHRVKYCRIVRKPFGKSYRYFVQLVMEGTPPMKYRLHGKGEVGADIGVSTVALYNNQHAKFAVLADGIERYDKQLKKYSRQAERRLRLNNPDCYNADGTAIKGKKPTVRSKGYRDAIMKLKTTYRKRSEYLLLSHRTLANQIVSLAETVITEPMDYKALQKKAKETKRQDIPSDIKQKDGSVKQVYKYKRRKRFGSSINRRAPSLFINVLNSKLVIQRVNCTKYKASQYDHITKEATKSLLSNRTKFIGTELVQRDLYSSFLLYNIKDNENIDFDACARNFDKFLLLQQNVVEEIKTKGDTTKNFGLKDFLKLENK